MADVDQFASVNTSRFCLRIVTVFTCGECEFEATDCDDMVQHLNLHDELTQTSNPDSSEGNCPDRQPLISDADRHWYKRPLFAIPTNDPNLLACSDCHAVFSSIVDISSHLRSGHVEFVCDENTEDDSASAGDVMYGEALNKSQIDQLRAAVIGDGTVGVSGSGNKNIKEECGSETEGDSRMEMAVTVNHSADGQFLCSLCEKIYVTRGSLVHHMSAVHGSRVPPPCQLCGSRFSTEAERATHINMHSPDLCVICGVRLPTDGLTPEDVSCLLICSICYEKNRKGCVDNTRLDITDDLVLPLTEADLELQLLAPLHKFYYCKDCSNAFVSNAELQKHVCSSRASLSNNHLASFGINKCLPVSDTAKNADESDNQVTTKSSRFECPICFASFKAQQYLRTHVKRLHTDAETRFVKKQSGTVLPPNSVKCVPADGSSSKQQVTGLVCEFCNDVLSSARTLLRHRQRLHSSELESDGNLEKTDPGVNNCEVGGLLERRTFNCENCGGAFFNRGALNEHIRLKFCQRETLDVVHNCSLCGRRFTKLHYLRKHMRGHSLYFAQNCLCNICGHRFTNEERLNEHMERHSNVRRYVCDTCKKSFKTKADLRSHIHHKHTGQKCICEVCGHEANSKLALKQHHRMQHSEFDVARPYACSLCTRRYFAACSLKIHYKSHDATLTDKRKVMCDVCKMRFRHIVNLKFHITTTHPDESQTPFACATCGDAFEHGEMFKKHYRSKHRNR